MIEIIVWEHLQELLDATVYLEIPDDAPEKYVTVEKTGSSETNQRLLPYSPERTVCMKLRRLMKK